MRVEFHNSVFIDPAVPQAALISVFQYCVNRHHAILDHNGADSPGRKWISQQAPALAEDLRLILDEGTENEARRPAERAIRIQAKTEPQAYDPYRMAPSDALRWLNIPVRIYVENSINDRAFLLSVTDTYYRDELTRRENRRELEFVHGGGNTLKEVAYAAAADTLSCWFGFVLFDSDAPLPTRRDTKMDNFRDALDEKGMRHHQLHRRAAENYLTRSQLSIWAGERHRVKNAGNWSALEAFFRLPPEIQAHFRMREGLEADENFADAMKWRAELDAAYQCVPDVDKAALKKCFGGAIRELFTTTPPKRAEAAAYSREFDSVIQQILSLA